MQRLFRSVRYEIKIALVYLLVSVCWIFFSDRFLNQVVTDPEFLAALQIYKGLAFILITTALLFFLVRRYAIKLRARRDRITQLLTSERSKRTELEEEVKYLEDILKEAPSAICILEGPDHRYSYANTEYKEMVNDRRLEGLTAQEALPELDGQGFFELLDDVYQTNETHKGKQVPFTIKIMGRRKPIIEISYINLCWMRKGNAQLFLLKQWM